MTAILVFVLVSVALLSGKVARIVCAPLRRYFVPSSIVGGLLALMVGPQIWGQWFPVEPGGLLDDVYRSAARLPGFLINVVFAALFLGKQIPPVREVWRRAGPQVAFGQAMAWGMYVVGLGVTYLVLSPWFGVPPVFGTLLEIGFEGGHGTAAGMESAFRAAEWEEGTDLALVVATVGVMMGVVLGMVLVNWAVRRGKTVFLTPNGYRRDLPPLAASPNDHSAEQDPPPAKAPERYKILSIEPISLHVAYIGIAIGIGVVLLNLLQFAEAQTLTRLGVAPLLQHMPLFPLAMIGGILLQQFHDRALPQLRLDRTTFIQLQNVALDYLIVAAMATLSLKALAANWQPLAILMILGIAWVLGMVLILGPRMLPDHWFERAIGDMGQSLGMTATGLLLMKIVDPEYRSPAFEAFGYKQLLFEPFVGGGLVTAMAVPLVYHYGPWPLFLVSLGLTAFWISFGLYFFRRREGN
jgi:glutamate:Na+ symporter, ESS family